MTIRPITEADLQAYVDGQLASARRADVEAFLAAEPAQAQRVAAYREQNDALHRLFDPVLDEPVPAPLRSRRGLRWWRRVVESYPRYAALLLAAAVGGAIGWSLRTPTAMTLPPVSVAQQAAVAHLVYAPEVRHPVEVSADQEAHLVSWLSKRVGVALRPPRLGDMGYELVGGRLLPGDRGPAAQFMYQDASGQRLTLYVRQVDEAGETAFRYAQEQRVGVFYWVDESLAYALSGEIDKRALLQVAQTVYHALNP